LRTLFLLLYFNYNVHSQDSGKIDLHLHKYVKPKIQFYDFKYKMKDEYYFKGDVLSWSSLKLKAQFIIPTKWGIIRFNLILPPVIPNGISFK